MKKWISMILITMVCFALTACGGGGGSSQPAKDVNFVNGLTSSLTEIYVSPETDENWSNTITTRTISRSSSIGFNFSDTGGDGPGVYDFAAMDENGWVYFVYGITLQKGDEMKLDVKDSTIAQITVTSGGSSTTYEGEIYDAADIGWQ